MGLVVAAELWYSAVRMGCLKDDAGPGKQTTVKGD
jgi:hypothetical protein